MKMNKGVENMTIQQIIDLLKMQGVNSKRQVIEMLQNATIDELYELKRDCTTLIAEKKTKTK